MVEAAWVSEGEWDRMKAEYYKVQQHGGHYKLLWVLNLLL